MAVLPPDSSSTPPPPPAPSAPPPPPPAAPAVPSSSPSQPKSPSSPPPPSAPPVPPPPASPPPPQSPPSQDLSSFTTPPPPPPPPGSAGVPSPDNLNVVKPRRGLPKVAVILLVLLVVILGITAAATFIFKYTPSLGIGTTTITYWGLWEPESVMQPLIQEFEAAHPRVKVVYQMQSQSEYRERLQSAISQNKGPDIFRIHNTWVPIFKNVLSPVPADVFTAASYDSTFYPVSRSDFRVGTNYVAVPLEFDGLLMYTNDELLSQSGIPIPTNWEDLRIAALAMSRCESTDGTCRPGAPIQISGASLGTTDNVDHWQDVVAVLMLQNNVNFSAPSSSTKAIEDVINFYTDFSALYHIWDSNLPNSTTQFANGKVGIYFAPSWRVFDIKQMNPSLKFSVHPLPQLPLDPLRNEKPIAYASYWAEAVNSKSAHTKEAWEFLKFLSESDSLTKLYQNAVATGRDFGEPYSRQEMASQLQNDPYVGVLLSQAPIARSWYLTSFTHDGPSGINTRLSDIFVDLISKKVDSKAFATKLNQVLSEYGLVAAPVTPQ